MSWTLGDDYFISSEIASLMGISRQAIQLRWKRRTILRVDTMLDKTTAGDRWRYPAFQFDVVLDSVFCPVSMTVFPHLRRLLREWDAVGGKQLDDDEFTQFFAPHAHLLDKPNEDTMMFMLDATRAEALRLLEV